MTRRREEEEAVSGGMPLPAELVRVGVVLLMDPYLIRGTIYLPPEVARFSDAWESVLADRRIFIPVTDAEILRGEETVLKTPFIHVRKADVRAASPLDEPPRPNRSDA